MRRLLSAFIACLLVSGLFFLSYRLLSSAPKTGANDEIHAVWLSYIDLTVTESEDRSADAFRRKCETILRNVTSHKMDTVFLHVRPFSDAIYPSAIYPWSACISGQQGVDPGFDPLAVFCETAKRFHVQVHAWINPFRICSDEKKWESVSEDNPAKQMLRDNDKSNDTAVVRAAGGVYYNPASPAVHRILLDGIRELLQNYPIAGIHIDDYFYPTQDASVDAEDYAKYRRNGGTLPPDTWRRKTVSALVKTMFDTVKTFGADKIFSISPAINIQYNHDVLYADTVCWCENSGYCDWIIPQIYVGFRHETQPFPEAAAQWNAMNFADGVRLLFGLAAYKCGQTDTYAGSGASEWTQYVDILSRQVRLSRTFSHCSGFVFFSYSAFFDENVSNNAKKELLFVTSVL